MPERPTRVRVLLAKVGFDGHDRGLKVVARILRDAGVEVIYAGLRQTPEMIAALALEEDVSVVALSMHNGSHMTLVPDVIARLAEVGLHTPIVVGGIIPSVDVPRLKEAGVATILGPGASADEIVASICSSSATSAP
jgi:methylmalonyl-CoA mutase C-terminal domain/subunit